MTPRKYISFQWDDPVTGELEVLEFWEPLGYPEMSQHVTLNLPNQTIQGFVMEKEWSFTDSERTLTPTQWGCIIKLGGVKRT